MVAEPASLNAATGAVVSWPPMPFLSCAEMPEARSPIVKDGFLFLSAPLAPVSRSHGEGVPQPGHDAASARSAGVSFCTSALTMDAARACGKIVRCRAQRRDRRLASSLHALGLEIKEDPDSARSYAIAWT